MAKSDCNNTDTFTVLGKLFPARKPPLLVVCCGLPGSGKSWFARVLSECKGYVAVCQDELKSRSACEEAFSAAVRKSKPVVVDRCNPTASSRDTWLALAHYPSSAVCVHFSADVEACTQRAEERLEYHPTLKSLGRVNAAMAHFKREFQQPSLNSEKFSTLFLVPSFQAAESLLLERFGVSADQLDAVKASSREEGQASSHMQILKFPRTRHLFNLGGASRDDMLMDAHEQMQFFKPATDLTLTLEEKVDGANLGISVDLDSGYKFKVQNRSHFVHSTSHIQFKALDAWLLDHSHDLLRILLQKDYSPGRLILFGEWLAATHSISYSSLPDKFLAFDIYDRIEAKFFSRTRFHESLRGTSIVPVPTLTNYSPPLDAAHIRQILTTRSSFADGLLEGVYLRLDAGDWLQERAKVVRADFIAGNEFWSKGQIKWNRVGYGTEYGTCS